MKKLKLKALDLGAKEILTREQLKNVLGGFDDDGSGKKKCTGQCFTSDGPGGATWYSCQTVTAGSAKNCGCTTTVVSFNCAWS